MSLYTQGYLPREGFPASFRCLCYTGKTSALTPCEE